MAEGVGGAGLGAAFVGGSHGRSPGISVNLGFFTRVLACARVLAGVDYKD